MFLLSHTASTPIIRAVNFNADKIVFVGSVVNLTVQVINSSSMTNNLKWSKANASLPEDSHTMDYSKDGNYYTALIIDTASYFNDGGTYYLTATNQCGTSIIYVILHIICKGNYSDR